MQETNFRWAFIAILILSLFISSCEFSGLEDAEAVVEGFSSGVEKRYLECLEEGSLQELPTRERQALCAEEEGYSASLHSNRFTTLEIDTIQTRLSNCEEGVDIAGGTTQYCTVTVDYVINYEAPSSNGVIYCTKDLFSERFEDEFLIFGDAGTYNLSFSSTDKWSAPEPGRADSIGCWLIVEERDITLFASNEERFARYPEE